MFWGPCRSARPGTHYVTKRQTTQGCNDTGGACDVYPHPRAHDPTFRRCTATLDRAVDPTRSCSPGDRGVEPTAGDTGDPDPPCRAPCNHIDPTGMGAGRKRREVHALADTLREVADQLRPPHGPAPPG
jgi:hypothetical protein